MGDSDELPTPEFRNRFRNRIFSRENHVSERTAKLVKFGRGGDTVFFSRRSTCSGYGTPENPHAARADKDDLDIPDGTPAIDTREAVETDEGFQWVFCGPMVDVDLPEGAVSETNPDPFLASMLSDVSPQIASSLAIHEVTRSEGRGSLDYVSISEYVEGWREHGARIGHYESGKIVWEDQ